LVVSFFVVSFLVESTLTVESFLTVESTFTVVSVVPVFELPLQAAAETAITKARIPSLNEFFIF